jgi:hypothetical protein
VSLTINPSERTVVVQVALTAKNSSLPREQDHPGQRALPASFLGKSMATQRQVRTGSFRWDAS